MQAIADHSVAKIAIRCAITDFFTRVENSLTICDRIREMLLARQQAGENEFTLQKDIPDSLEEFTLKVPATFDEIRQKVNESKIIPLIDEKERLIQRMSESYDQIPESQYTILELIEIFETNDLRPLVNLKSKILTLANEISPVEENTSAMVDVTFDAKFRIYETILQARANSASDSELKQIRKSLSDDLSISLGAVSAMSAWVLIQADRHVQGNFDVDRETLISLAWDRFCGKEVQHQKLVDEYLKRLFTRDGKQPNREVGGENSRQSTSLNPLSISNGHRNHIIRTLIPLYANEVPRGVFAEVKELLSVETGFSTTSIGSIGAHILIKAKALTGGNPKELLNKALQALNGQSVVDPETERFLNLIFSENEPAEIKVTNEDTVEVVAENPVIQKVQDGSISTEFIESMYPPEVRSQIDVFVIGESTLQFSKLGFARNKINRFKTLDECIQELKKERDHTPLVYISFDAESVSDFLPLQMLSGLKNVVVTGVVFHDDASIPVRTTDHPSILRFLATINGLISDESDGYFEMVRDISSLQKKEFITVEEAEWATGRFEQWARDFTDELHFLTFLTDNLKVTPKSLIRAAVSSPLEIEILDPQIKDLTVPDSETLYTKISTFKGDRYEDNFFAYCTLSLPNHPTRFDELSDDQKKALNIMIVDFVGYSLQNVQTHLRISRSLMGGKEFNVTNSQALSEAILFNRPFIENFDVSNFAQKRNGKKQTEFFVHLVEHPWKKDSEARKLIFKLGVNYLIDAIYRGKLVTSVTGVGVSNHGTYYKHTLKRGDQIAVQTRQGLQHFSASQIFDALRMAKKVYEYSNGLTVADAMREGVKRHKNAI